MAAIAHDIGMTVTVNSDYLPANLVTGKGLSTT